MDATVGVSGDGTVRVTDKDGKEIGSLTQEQTVKKAVDKSELKSEVNKEDITKASNRYKNADKAKKDAYYKELAKAKKVLANPNAIKKI